MDFDFVYNVLQRRISNSTDTAHPSSGSGAGSKAGLEIWRIENKKPVAWPAEKYGHFYAGDSYLILNTTISKSGKFEWDLFFWLGKDSSVDEMGIAAYKTVS